MPVAALLILSSAAALKPALAPPLQPAGPHGLPLLPSGDHLTLDAPGWTRGIGTGGRVWPASAALCRYLVTLNASSVILTEGGSDGLIQLARRNVDANQ